MIQQQQQKTSQWVLTSVQFHLVHNISSYLVQSITEFDIATEYFVPSYLSLMKDLILNS